jgi:Regulator of chromosome condensation (RCC1) repeat
MYGNSSSISGTDLATSKAGARYLCIRGQQAGRGTADQLRRFGSVVVALLSAAGCGGIGGNDGGSLPTGDPTDITTPTAVATSLRFTDLAVGLHHACGLTAAGIVYCWGSNEYGQLGSTAPMALCDGGQSPCSSAPVPVASAEAFVEITASLRDTCAVTRAGAAWCWGYGDGGQLGDGLSTSSATPVQVTGPTSFATVELGGSGLISCGITLTGAGYCWGPGGGGGGLGDGTTGGANAPVAIEGGLAFTTLSVGDDHACGISTAGVTYCWGHNTYGKLGQGMPGASSVPSPVAGGLTFTSVSAGLEHTCSLTADGSAYCWGFPLAVGSAVTGSDVLAPTPVSGGKHFKAISAGEDQSCALDDADAAWCWGQNFDGELGDGTHTDRVEPVAVSTNLRFIKIRAGGSSCALDAGGQAYCWGSNNYGQAGQPP